jgi:exopolyphosphatase/guanosine-5'-triphosphate,3'-diphosphate pyrophosphatase
VSGIERGIGAAIDIGSNSIHLLVAEVDEGRALHVIQDESVLLGLGAVVDLDGRIPDDHVASAVQSVNEYAAAAVDSGAERVIVLATEPLRRASNRSQFATTLETATDRRLHILSHEEEAGLTLIGVLGGQVPEEPTLVFDIGGGSSETVLLEAGSDPVVGVLPVGSARLTASHVEDDPPTADEIAALRSEARHLLSSLPAGHPRRGIVVGGTGMNLLKLTPDPDDDDPIIDLARADAAMKIVASRPAAELVDVFGLRERRAAQMAAGVSLIEAALDCYSLNVLEVSEASLREGAVLAAAMAGDEWLERLDDLVAGA